MDFPRPTRYGDRLTFKLWTIKVGRSSCEVRIEASFHGELRMQVRQVLVFIRASDGRPTAIPPEIVGRMKRFVLEPTELAPLAPPAPRGTRKTKRS